MKKKTLGLIWVLVVLLVLSLCGTAAADEKTAADQHKQYAVWSQVAEQAADQAWEKMGGHPQDLLVLTNAGYAVVSGFTTEPCLDGLAAVTGCSAGRATLLDVHSSCQTPLWFFIFDKQTGQGVFCQVNGQAVAELMASRTATVKFVPAAKLFTKVSTANIAAEKLLADPASWNEQVKSKVFNGFEFAIVTIANVAAEGAPYDLIKCALFHDHLCPGVTSGYFLADYLTKNFPLRSPSEKYYVLCAPSWCKDDGLQVLLNTTPGKQSLAVLPLNAQAKAALPADAKDMAGVFFRYDSTTQKGDAVVLGFSFDKVASASGIDLNKGFPWESRLKSDLWYLDYMDQSEKFVRVIKTFDLAAGEVPADYAQPGVDLLGKLGFCK